MDRGPAVWEGLPGLTVFLPLLRWEQVVSLGDGWEAEREKTLINGTACDRLALAKLLTPYR